MPTPEPFMIGDVPAYVCTGDHGCGSLVRQSAWPHHVEFHLRIDGAAVAVSRAIRTGARRAS